jgi:hypothetical protein
LNITFLSRNNFTVFIPVIDLQGDQNPDDHEHDFTNSVFEVFIGFAFNNKILADISKEFYHG